MNKIYYPAVFHPEEVGFSVFVPDVQGCATQGDTLEEATEMALDAIGLCLEETKDFPTPSLPSSIQTEPGDFVALVPFDALEYQKKYSSRAVKKTLTIPAWLNSLAEEHHVNFSSVLQSALKQQLHLDS
ncbi:MAG: type II toxin-antitoxin system HicB family antitoxin [Acutalibacter sp.]